MARGDVKFFASFFQKGFDAVGFDLNAGDALKLGIVTNTIVPTVSTADPRWGAGGTTNLSSNQVALATAYTGPIAIVTPVLTISAGVVTLDFADIAVAQDAVGFTNGYWGILYDDTVAGKYAIGFIDLGGPVSLVGGALNININAAGFGTLTAT